jgi:GMP synthase (glutamine-hydrolysing)
MSGAFRILVAESETEGDRETRRNSVGRSSGETYRDTIAALVPGASCEIVRPADTGPDSRADALDAFDAVFLTGSPLHAYVDTPEVRRQIEFMRAVFRSGTPSFGSCAGLQVAAVAAGGTARANPRGCEPGLARDLSPNAAGAGHPLLAGRPERFEAGAIHTDEVAVLPDGALLLASNPHTTVQAAEIVHEGGTFWGVQYHPELPLAEIGAALRRQADQIVAQGVLPDAAAVEARAAALEALERGEAVPGLPATLELTDPWRRQRELRNFIEFLAGPVRSARARG